METYSDWFPRDVTPVHVGVYEVRIKANGKIVRWFSFWNSAFWCLSAGTPELAATYRARSDAAEHAGGFEWRGILK